MPKQDVKVIPPRVRDELAVTLLLSALIGTSLRAEVDGEVLCSDASGGRAARGGVVGCKVPGEVADELYRNRLRKGGYVRAKDNHESEVQVFLDELEADGLLPPPEDPDARPCDERWFGHVCDALGWKRLFDFPFGADPDGGYADLHINFLELRAARAAIRARIKSGVCFSRILLGVDSDVVAYTLAKGRSSSKRLNAALRPLAAELMFTGLHIGVLRVESARNPADAPSRRRPVRKAPVVGCEAWAMHFVAGSFAPFRATLADHRGHWFIDYDDTGSDDGDADESPG